MKRRAKIVATIGPSTSSVDRLRELVDAGMDVARLNFSFGDPPSHLQTIKDLRRVSGETGRPVAIMQDLQGPKVRIGQLAQDPTLLEPDETLVLTTKPVLGTAELIQVDFPDLPRDASPGMRLLLDDGHIELKITKVMGSDIETQVVRGGMLRPRKGVNFPGFRLSMPTLTTKDKQDLTFGLEHGVDIVAMSFVHDPQDLAKLREAIASLVPNRRNVPIIAKLERAEALAELDGILDVTDGVMVARGDLGVELSPARVPSLQKHIIRRANAKLRTVITATQMLESMVHSPRPTRAEASDVANAVFDGTDALMLSGETAIGDYPVEALRTMHEIILDAEAHAVDWGVQPGQPPTVSDDATATSLAARELAHDCDVVAIAVFTRSGRTARLMSKARPQVPILAFTPEKATYQQMSLLWGVLPLLVPMAHSVEEMIQRVQEVGVASRTVQAGDQVVIVASLPVGKMGPPNFTLLHRVT